MARTCPASDGFTFAELMVAVVIIGVLSAMAIPMYVSAHVQAAQRTCFSNQRYVEGTTSVWVTSANDRELADLTGVVNRLHPLVVEHYIGRIPTCPAAPEPVDGTDPTVTEGVYTLQADGTVAPCAFGELEVHGHF